MDDRLFGSLEWRCIGPHRGGRCVAVAGHPTEPGTFYFGALRRRRLEDHQRRLALGERLRRLLQDRRRRRDRRLRLRPERHLRRAPARRASAATSRTATASTGRTTAADSWRNLGLAETRHIGRVVVHPHEPRPRLRRRARPRLGPEPGARRLPLHATAARRWDLVLHKSDRAGAADLTHGPEQPAHPVRRASGRPGATRTPPISGGEDSGIWRSRSTAATPGPTSPATRACRRACSARSASPPRPPRPGRVWALVEAEDGALFRSDDYGETWERLWRRRRPAPAPLVLHAHLRRPAGRRTPSGC